MCETDTDANASTHIPSIFLCADCRCVTSLLFINYFRSRYFDFSLPNFRCSKFQFCAFISFRILLHRELRSTANVCVACGDSHRAADTQRNNRIGRMEFRSHQINRIVCAHSVSVSGAMGERRKKPHIAHKRTQSEMCAQARASSAMPSMDVDFFLSRPDKSKSNTQYTHTHARTLGQSIYVVFTAATVEPAAAAACDDDSIS